MNEKYTIRDFLVYLTTGSFVLLTLLYHFKNSLFRFFQIDIHSIEKTTTLYVLLLIPGLYLVGHIVQGVDYILLFKVGNYMKKAAKKKNQIISKFFSSWVV